MAQETTAAITTGKLHPFTGPIYKQDGSIGVPEGQTLEGFDLVGMDWYVQGVDDQL